MSKTILIFCVLVAMGVFVSLEIYPQLQGPNRAGEPLNSLGATPPEDSAPDIIVTGAEIVSETDNSLLVRYSLDNNSGDIAVSACGDVEYGNNGYAWGCRPLIIPKNAKSIEITYALAFSARKIECSDSVGIRLYIGSGFSFYTHTFALEKVWHKSPGIMSWFNYRQHGCE